MANNAVQIGGARGVSSFQQQGQLDWVAFGSTVYSASLAAMKRLADSGIQPLTHGAGLALAIRFQLSENGNRRVEEAVAQLRVYRGFEGVLWFGFGQKSFVRLLAEQQAGVNLLALCASLGETYGSAHGARYLKALWRVQEYPQEYEPSRSQFERLVDACAGVLISTPFASVVFRMARRPAHDKELAEGVDPEDYARALTAIFDVSRSKLSGVEICGTHHVAFLAAFAHWLLGLSVWVRDIDGSTIFCSVHVEEHAQVKLQYVEPGDARAELALSSSSFVLRSFTSIVHEDHCLPVILRIPWESCLEQIFGSYIDKFKASSKTLGLFLGSVAAALTALVDCDVHFEPITAKYYTWAGPDGNGKAFVIKTCRILPELDSFEGLKTEALRVSDLKAERVLASMRSAVAQLRAKCECAICIEDDSDRTRWDHCLLEMAFFIARLGHMMGPIICDSPVLPHLCGLMSIYTTVKNERKWQEEVDRRMTLPEDLIAFMAILNLKDRDPLVYYSTIETALKIFLDDTLEIPPAFKKRTRTAISMAGICVWSESLRELQPNAHSLSLVHLVSGSIEHNGRRYSSVVDPKFKINSPETPFVPADFTLVPKDGVAESTSGTVSRLAAMPNLTVQGIATEQTDQTLIFGYQVLGMREKFYLYPGMITTFLEKGTGRIGCASQATCSDKVAMPCAICRQGWVHDDQMMRLREQGVHCYIWLSIVDRLERLLLMQKYCDSSLDYWVDNDGRRHRTTYIIRNNQCLACITAFIRKLWLVDATSPRYHVIL